MDRVKADIAQITGDGSGFGVPVTFIPPTGPQVTVNCLGTRHHIAVDQQGVAYNGKNAHVSVSETNLLTAGYTTRDAENRVALVGHKLKWTDASGTERTYKIGQTFPDDTVGLIVCILEDFE